MYKCKECGCEYDIKPDFCECGNDEFETIAEESIPEIAELEPIKVEEAKPITSEPVKTNYNDERYVSKKTLSSGDIISIIIFVLCLLLSGIIIILPVKQTEQLPANKEEQTQTVTKNIPSIDKFWNNSLPQTAINEEPKQEEVKKEIKIPAPIQNIIPTVKPQQKTTQTQTKSNITTAAKKPQQKPVQQSKPTVQNKPQQVQNTQQKPQTTVQKPQNQTVQKPQTQPSAPQTTTNTTPRQTQGQTTVKLQKNPDISTVEQANNSAASKQEFANYKASLRNTIGRKIDFTKVVGDGNCSVAFKIDSSGRLVNRSFSKQSSNMTLNDAVYAAVMSTPSFEAPPAAYKGETLTLNIKFINGNFEISLY